MKIHSISCGDNYQYEYCLYIYSAGIGRTGTYIGLDYVVNQAKEVDYVDVFGSVEGLRRQRVNMVQTQVCTAL